MLRRPAASAGASRQNRSTSSFTARHAPLAARQDRTALLVLAGTASALLVRGCGSGTPPLHLAYLCFLLISLNLALCWQRTSPASWQRWRVAAASALRLVLLPGALLTAQDCLRLLSNHGGLAESPGLSTAVYILALLSPGAVVLALASLGLHLPPVPDAALQLGSTLALIAFSTAYAVQHLGHENLAPHMHTLYAWLQPAIAPLEPLVSLAGQSPRRPSRHGFCVLLVVQLWIGFVLPTLLAVYSAGRAFGAYRLERLRQLVVLQQRAEQRYWSQAAARRRLREAQAQGAVLSTSSSSSTSESSSPGALSEADAALLEAAASMDALVHAYAYAPTPAGLLLPGDWQYELAFQAHLMLRQLAGWPALPISAGLCLLYAWHVLVFP